jgi:LytTr DNA-binding domain
MLLAYKTRDEPARILCANRLPMVAMRDTVRDLPAASANEPVARDPMTYRRDLVDVRVVGRHSDRDDSRNEPARRAQSAPRPPAPAAGPATTESDTELSPDVILVKVGVRQVATRVQEILYIESARNYVRVYLEGGSVLKSRVPLDRLARHLGADRFLRIHRGRLVNRARIRAVSPLLGSRLQLTLDQGSTIVVARDRRRSVLAEIGAVPERDPRSPTLARSRIR